MADVPSSAFNRILVSTDENRFTIIGDSNRFSKPITCLVAEESDTDLVPPVVVTVKHDCSSCVSVPYRVSSDEVISVERNGKGLAGHPICDDVRKVGRLGPFSLDPIEN
jgi:hypothetical protein